MVFAWAFGVSFNLEPLRRYLAGREKLGGLNEDELRAECFLSWTAMNFNEMTCRDFVAYLEANQTRIADTMPANLLMAMRIDALLRDNQVERARAILLERDGDLDEVEAARFSAMIDALDGVDSRERFERAYRDTGSVVDLQNLVGCLQESDDREALLPILQELVLRQRTVANAMNLVACLSNRPFLQPPPSCRLSRYQLGSGGAKPRSPDRQSVGTLPHRPIVGRARVE